VSALFPVILRALRESKDPVLFLTLIASAPDTKRIRDPSTSAAFARDVEEKRSAARGYLVSNSKTISVGFPSVASTIFSR
jgi:hypothetical protein